MEAPWKSPPMPLSPSSKRVRTWSVRWSCTIPIQRFRWFLRFLSITIPPSPTPLLIFFLNKVKTTSPEKFKVKPSTGCLKPGAKDTVTVTLLPGFQLGGLSKDKFLIMSLVLEEGETANSDISELWKVSGCNIANILSLT